VESAVRDFRAGALDAVVDVPPSWVDRARRRRGARAIALVGKSYVFLGWNLRDGRFGDPAVRRAAALAVDTQRLLRDLTLGQGDPCRGPLTALAGFADTTRILPHDPAAARRALEAAGWRDESGDGVRQRRGARLEFYLLAPGDDALRLEAARRIARDLGAVGMRVHVREMGKDEILRRLNAHAFEAFMGQWFPDAEGQLDAIWRSDAVDQLNFTGYASPATDSLLTLLSHEMEPNERALVLSHFQARVYADQPYLFLFQNPHFLLLAPRVRGAEPSVVSPFWNLPQWWIPARLRR
jgi:peptide/nickel transport system substrate-binding protein